MATGWIDCRTAFVFHEAAHVVHLQAEQMTDTVWHECRRDAETHEIARIAVCQFDIYKHIGCFLMSLQVYVAIIDACTDRIDDRPLQDLHAIEQTREQLAAVTVGSRDVRCIAMNLCARVYEE